MTSDVERAVIDRDELAERISALSSVDHQRLLLAARRLADGLGMTGEDLLQQAFLHVLEGHRHCPANVDAKTFIYGVLRSLASSRRKSEARHPEAELHEFDATEDGSADPPPADCRFDPAKLTEEEAAARELMHQLEVCFADDEDVQLLILSRANGDTPAETKAVLGKNDREYATICKRLRRGYTRLIRKEES